MRKVVVRNTVDTVLKFVCNSMSDSISRYLDKKLARDWIVLKVNYTRRRKPKRRKGESEDA